MGALVVCPECGHEFSSEANDSSEAISVVKDANGNILQDGDSVVVIKDLKLKGNATAIKVGTKARNIRLIEPVNGHDIDAKVDGFGSILLKSSVVKKA
jgi:protein PhnA